MPYPKIKLLIDQKAEIKNAQNFVSYNNHEKQFVQWFLPTELQYLLTKNFTTQKRNTIIESYVKNFHQKNSRQIKQGIIKAKKDWLTVEKVFFRLVDEIFHGQPWSKGNYRGYASIFNMYPRYIKEKFFFFPYQNRKTAAANNTIAHEMLHFIFFDYLDKNFGIKEHTTIKGKNKKYVWRISEVFNNVIESWPPYKKIFHSQPKPYPGTEKMFVKMKKQWAKKPDIFWLMNQWIKKKR